MTAPRREILRYLGYKNTVPSEAVIESIDKIERQVAEVAEPKSVKKELAREEVIWSGTTVEKALYGCNRAVLFAATLGVQVDRLLMRTINISMSDAVILQAVAAAMIEQVCDDLQAEYNSRPRVSPGYGDFELSAQRDILRILDAPRKIGLSVTEALMLVPTKSVTAIFGIKEDACEGLGKEN